MASPRSKKTHWEIEGDLARVENLAKWWPKWEKVIEECGGVDLVFRSVVYSELVLIKRAIYEQFGGRQITCHRTYSTLRVHVSKERIRTSAKGMQSGTGRKLTGTQKMDEAFGAVAFGGELFEISKKCPICERSLPLGQFHRGYGKKEGVQSYCKKCKKAYDHWKYLELKKRGITRLKPEVTDGGRNEVFRQWLANQ